MKGAWFDASGRRKVITQYHETIGHFLGRKMQVGFLFLVNDVVLLDDSIMNGW